LSLCQISFAGVFPWFKVTGMIKLRQLRCSFCGKKEAEVLKLVAGPRVCICDACVAIASEVIDRPHDDNQPPRVKPSAWRKLIAHARRFVSGADEERVHIQPAIGSH